MSAANATGVGFTRHGDGVIVSFSLGSHRYQSRVANGVACSMHSVNRFDKYVSVSANHKLRASLNETAVELVARHLAGGTS